MKYTQVVVFVIIICIAAVFIIPSVVIHDEEDKYARERRANDSLRVVNDSIRAELNRSYGISDSLRALDRKVDQKIIYLKQKSNEDLRLINKFTLTQLDSFFSSRTYTEAQDDRTGF